MRTQTLHWSRISIVAAAFLLLVPATALAGDDTQQLETQNEVAEVTLDDMTVDSEQTEESYTATAGEDYFAQQGTYPGLAASIGLNALWGGVTGALIGTGLWLFTDMDADMWTIAQFAGGGILIGGVIGLASWLVWGETAGTAATAGATDNAEIEQPASVDWVDQDTPDVYDIDLIRLGF